MLETGVACVQLIIYFYMFLHFLVLMCSLAQRLAAMLDLCTDTAL
jgi:hypothetical protein